MALSEELKKVYSSNPTAIRSYDTVQLTHSKFTEEFYLVKDDIDHDFNLEDGSTVTFKSFPFTISLPEVGSPQQDMSFQFDNVGREAMPQLELAAENIEEPIILTYRVYIDGFMNSQTTPISLNLSNIVADNYYITAVASRPNLYERRLPTGNKSTFDNRFYGLSL